MGWRHSANIPSVRSSLRETGLVHGERLSPSSTTAKSATAAPVATSSQPAAAVGGPSGTYGYVHGNCASCDESSGLYGFLAAVGINKTFDVPAAHSRVRVSMRVWMLDVWYNDNIFIRLTITIIIFTITALISCPQKWITDSRYTIHTTGYYLGTNAYATV